MDILVEAQGRRLIVDSNPRLECRVFQPLTTLLTVKGVYDYLHWENHIPDI